MIRWASEQGFVAELEGLYEGWRPDAAPAPMVLVANASLAAELGIDPTWLASSEGIAAVLGSEAPPHPTVAQAYAGHQFGNYSPRLGDGRALLLGEALTTDGRRVDIHLKGSGRTTFSRGGDGKAAVGPMLREYVIGEALHALGLPTTRALVVIATGETIARDRPLPGAVLARVASSHLRVGSFQYAASSGDTDLVRRLADHAIARHYPQCALDPEPYLAFLEAVSVAQARLVSQWMAIGFIHGVMNTDNMAISGEAIDFGPCAFMEVHDPRAVFSSIDHSGRYAYGQQPGIAQWNLARLAETLLPLLHHDTQEAIRIATEAVENFAGVFRHEYLSRMRAKAGLVDPATPGEEAAAIVNGFLALMTSHRVDHTLGFRSLSGVLRGQSGAFEALFANNEDVRAWRDRWLTAVPADPSMRLGIADGMDAVNPVHVPRNHLVEEALAAATAGDLAPLEALVDILRVPFERLPDDERYLLPAPDGWEGYMTFCGT
ncbi:MAG: hypothetical protein RJB65_30 [Actinomycetota bacterium]